MNILYGIFLATNIAIVAKILSFVIPSLGSVTLAIIIGALVGNFVKFHSRYDEGIVFTEKKVLAFAIGLMGVNLDFEILSQLGFKVIILIIISIIFTLYFSVLLAKLFKFDKKFALTLGIGNGICGSAAIAATKDILDVDKQKAALSVAIVNFLGTIGIFLLPFIGSYILELSDVNIGVLVGNTLQAVGQAIASGFSVNDDVGQSATIVKMGRILMLTPVILFLIYMISKENQEVEKSGNKIQIPLFVVAFIAFSMAATFKVFPNGLIEYISLVSNYFLLVAMAAIGLRINFKVIKEHGSMALLIASIIFFVQIAFSSVTLLTLF